MLNDSPSLSNSSLTNMNNQTNQPSLQTTFSSSYPIPPMQYVNLYSDENILKNKSLDPPKPITEGKVDCLYQNMFNFLDD